MNSLQRAKDVKAEQHKVQLRETGFLQVKSLHCESSIAKWNHLLDSVFQSELADKRPYVFSDKLYELGILEEIFNEGVINLVEHLIPNARIYHCHAYETAANQKKSHIHGDNGLEGWHRDGECLFAYEQHTSHHLTLFINLTDIDEENGPFEFSWLAPHQNLKSGLDSLKVTGKQGTTFLFDRNFYHRATPNRSLVRRRVIKISFQDAYLPNETIYHGTIEKTAAALIESHADKSERLTWLQHFFGGDDQGSLNMSSDASYLTDESLLPDIVPRSPNSKISLSSLGLLKNKYHDFLIKEPRLLHLTPDRPKAKVLVIGSGNRIQNNFLPALSCCHKFLEVDGIYSRTPANAQAVADKWKTKAYASFNDIDFSRIDVVMVSVSTSAVPQVLKKLQKHGKNLHLLLDTPVMDGVHNAINLRLLRVFRNIQVAEDFMNFPQFALMRELIEQNKIGCAEHVCLENTGYRYHGVALAKSLLGFPKVRSYKRVNQSKHHIQFLNDTTADLILPYQRLDGRVFVRGTDANILYSPNGDHGSFTEGDKPLYIVTHKPEQASTFQVYLSGQMIEEYPMSYHQELSNLVYDYDKSFFNLYKTEGLIRVMQSLKEVNLNSHYTYLDCYRDNLASVNGSGVKSSLKLLGRGLKAAKGNLLGQNRSKA